MAPHPFVIRLTSTVLSTYNNEKQFISLLESSISLTANKIKTFLSATSSQLSDGKNFEKTCKNFAMRSFLKICCSK